MDRSWKKQGGALAAWFQQPWVNKTLRVLITGGILAYLGYRLSLVGWAEVWAALPTQPAFYLVVVVMYFLLPTCEAFIYSRIWPVGYGQWWSVMARKKVLNQDLMGYSGEVFLFWWARQHLQASRRYIGLVIKDNLILSSMASIGTAVLLLFGLIATGLLVPTDLMANPTPVYVGVGIFVLLLVVSLATRLRKVLFKLPRRLLVMAGSVHIGRFVLNYILQVLQWWIVAPEVPMQAWAILLAAMVLINRIPFLPSRDLIFIGTGIELAVVLGVPEALLAGLLVARTAFDKLLNLLLFAGATFWERRYGQAPLAKAEAEEAS